jgi:hypothetical protein
MHTFPAVICSRAHQDGRQYGMTCAVEVTTELTPRVQTQVTPHQQKAQTEQPAHKPVQQRQTSSEGHL